MRAVSRLNFLLGVFIVVGGDEIFEVDSDTLELLCRKDNLNKCVRGYAPTLRPLVNCLL